MQAIPWEVDSFNMTDAYVAGFLDGDGSLVATVQSKPERKRVRFRIHLRVTFSQHWRHRGFMEQIQKHLGVGSLREVPSRKLVELVITNRSEVRTVVERLLPHLVLKKRQAELMLAAIAIYNANVVNVRSVLNDQDLEKVVAFVQEVRRLNSGTGGKRDTRKLFDPVTT